MTPLHCAARSGQVPIISCLLDRGAGVALKTKNGLTPLHVAVQGDHADSVRELIRHDAPLNETTAVSCVET